MPPVTSREIRLTRHPTGMPDESTFELAEVTLDEPTDGQILVRNIWMSVDPYMRGRMTGIRTYVDPFQVGQPLDGGCVGQVVASKNNDYSVGDYVFAMNGWREYWLSDGSGIRQVDPALAPIQAYLGVLGMPGLTAYAGMIKIGEVRDGETVFVSAAAGAVGAVACQIGKNKGCRVVGSAGSKEKIDWLLNEAGVDEAFNYKEGDFNKQLGQACPDGIDVYFENVGGPQLEAALGRMRDFGRVVVCGMIDQYNATSPPPGPRTIINVIPRRLRIQGFIVTDHFDLMPQFIGDMGGWIGEGRMKWKETVVEGIENAPTAFLGLFSGDNIGKMLVRLGPDPAV